MKKDLLSRLFPVPKVLSMPALGIDISDRAIKYAQLAHPDRPEFVVYGEERIEPGVVEGGLIKNHEGLVSALKRVRQASRNHLVHAALPEEKAYVADIEVPTGASGDMRETIELHLDEHIPLDPISTIFDFEMVAKDEVVISAVEQGLAESYALALEEAGFLPLSFELESHALARAFVPHGSLETFMIVDIGRQQSNLFVVGNGIVRLAASIDVGGGAIATAIQADLKVSPEEARKVKEEEGLLNRGKKGSAFQSIIRITTILRDEIEQRFNYWNSAHKERVSHIILCGGNSSIPGLANYLGTGLPVAVGVGNTWINVASFDKYIPEITAREALKFGTAIGLALKSHD